MEFIINMIKIFIKLIELIRSNLIKFCIDLIKLIIDLINSIKLRIELINIYRIYHQYDKNIHQINRIDSIKFDQIFDRFDQIDHRFDQFNQIEHQIEDRK